MNDNGQKLETLSGLGGGWTASIFENNRVNRQTGEAFTVLTVSFSKYIGNDEQGRAKYLSFSVDARDLDTLAGLLGDAATSCRVQKRAQSLARRQSTNAVAPAVTAPAMQQPATTPAAPQVDDIPF